MPQRLHLEGADPHELLVQAREQYGPHVTVVRAERVRSGGVMGFFAKEIYELTLEVPDTALAVEAGPSSTRPVIEDSDRMSPQIAAEIADAEALRAEMLGTARPAGAHQAFPVEGAQPATSQPSEAARAFERALDEAVGTAAPEDLPSVQEPRTFVPAAFPAADPTARVVNPRQAPEPAAEPTPVEGAVGAVEADPAGPAIDVPSADEPEPSTFAPFAASGGDESASERLIVPELEPESPLTPASPVPASREQAPVASPDSAAPVEQPVAEQPAEQPAAPSVRPAAAAHAASKASARATARREAAARVEAAENTTANVVLHRWGVQSDLMDAVEVGPTAADLLALGVPPRLLGNRVALSDRVPLLEMVARLGAPTQRRLEPGELLVVTGAPDRALAVARQVASWMGLPDQSVALAGECEAIRGHGRRIRTEAAARAARARAEEAASEGLPVVVALGIAPGRRGAIAATPLLSAFEADATWFAVDAGEAHGVAAAMEPLAVGAHVDAIAAVGVGRSQAPASLLDAELPVAWMDGLPASPTVWGALLAERIAAHR
ncbi:hypothetical protein [Demequina sp. NBRC 110054]|uniref:hypothetical protein n=1 Tax=Demequina sp. NBRC 110054 TaxID=1570343 RepID=UPI001178B7F6|nr:hypothetical protein [Demequina sp. NBRC 110054]